MDEADIAFHTRHAQSSVGRYRRDYERVKLLIKHGVSLEQISPMIDMQPTVVNTYAKLMAQYHPDLLPNSIIAPEI